MKTTSTALLELPRGVSPEELTPIRQRGLGILRINEQSNTITVMGGTRKIRRLCRERGTINVVEIKTSSSDQRVPKRNRPRKWN